MTERTRVLWSYRAAPWRTVHAVVNDEIACNSFPPHRPLALSLHVSDEPFDPDDPKACKSCARHEDVQRRLVDLADRERVRAADTADLYATEYQQAIAGGAL